MNRPLETPWFHVIWTTQLAWQPTDPRGDWRHLAQLYDSLGELARPSSPLPRRYRPVAPPPAVVELPPAARQLVAQALADLTVSDRLAGDTPLAASAVGPYSVQLVLSCPDDALHQRVGRLKSRSATLLGFEPELAVGGKGTWSRGFWWARLGADSLVHSVAAFVRDPGPFLATPGAPSNPDRVPSGLEP